MVPFSVKQATNGYPQIKSDCYICIHNYGLLKKLHPLDGSYVKHKHLFLLTNCLISELIFNTSCHSTRRY